MDSRQAFELQKLLTEEQTRTEQHKLNYQTLKLDHQRLQEECATLQTELRGAVEARARTDELERRLAQQAERELAETRVAIDELNHRSMSMPSEMDKLNRIHEEAERKLTKRILKAEEETDSYRTELNRMRCEYGFLRQEYEQDRLEVARQLENMKLRYETELTQLREKYEAPGSSESTQSLRKENDRLKLKVSALSTELKESLDELERVASDTSAKGRQRGERISELTARLASLELEKSTTSHLCEKLQHDLRSCDEELASVRKRLIDTEADRNRLKLLLDDCERKVKMDAANNQTDVAKTKIEFDAQMSRLQQRNKDLKGEIDQLKLDLEIQRRLLRESEVESVKKLETMHQESVKRQKNLEDEKSELVTKCREVEEMLKQARSSTEADVAKVEEKLQRVLESKRSLETDLLVMETKMEGHRKLVVEADKLRQDNEALASRLDKLTCDARAEAFEAEKAAERNERLRELLEKARQKLESHEAKVQKIRSAAEKASKEAQDKWDEQRTELKEKLGKANRLTKELKQDLGLRTKSYKKKTGQYVRLIKKLRSRLELVNARVEELQIERENLQKWVPHDVHNVVKKQLRNLRLRHDEYNRLLQSHQPFGAEAARSSGTVGLPPTVLPLDGGGGGTSVASVWLLAQQQESLNAVKERLRQLHGMHNDQLDTLIELKGTASGS